MRKRIVDNIVVTRGIDMGRTLIAGRVSLLADDDPDLVLILPLIADMLILILGHLLALYLQ